MKKGLDIVAACEDRTARYFNFSGAAVVWDRPDASLDNPVNLLLDTGRVVAPNIGPSPFRLTRSPRWSRHMLWHLEDATG